MKAGTESKLKFKKLQRRLSLPLWQAIGLLEALWTFTALNAPAGDVGRHSDEDIAAWLEWGGDEADLIAVLVECEWLDEDETHRLIIHDWHDHAPNYVKGFLARYGKDFVSTKQPTKQPTEQATKQATKQPTRQPANSTLPPSQVKSSLVKSSQAKSKKGSPAAADIRPTSDTRDVGC